MALEWSPGVPVTIDNLTPVFHRCVEVGDAEGLEHVLHLAAVVDFHTAQQWIDDLKFAVRFRRLIEG